MTSVAVLIDSYEIQQIWQRKVSPSSRFDEIAARLRRIAKIVKQEWNNFPLENREQLKELAYTLIEPRKGLPNLKRAIWVAVYMLLIKATNQTAEFHSCIEALDMLVDNILDAVEQEDPSYQAALSATLEQLYSKKVQGKVLEVEETREWLRNLSDSALGEI